MLVFVPGIMGSELISRGADGRKRAIWSGELSVLYDALIREPRSLRLSDIEHGGVIRRITGPVTVEAYGLFLDQLKQRGFVEGKNLRLFPYDWRLDIRTTAGRFIAEMERIGASEIDIVAHSMGGLVVRLALLKNPSLARRVNRYVQVGTPCLGSLKAFRTLKAGDLGLSRILDTVMSISQRLKPQLHKDLVDSLRGMASIYQLLPPGLLTLRTPSQVWLSALDPEAWQPFERQSVALAKETHEQLREFSFDRILAFSDSGLDTNQTLEVDTFCENPRPLGGVPGDGTVTVESSVFNTPLGRRRTLHAAVAHDDLLCDIRYQYQIFEELGIST